MKATFYKLEESKRARIEAAAFAEFAENGYDRATLDAIVARARISKGGLYEYIEAKEDLFGYALEKAYSRMREYILSRIVPGDLPGNPLARARLIAGIAVEFYLENPAIIEFLASSASTEHPAMRSLALRAFSSYFEGLFSDCDFSVFRFDRSRILEVMGWILVKTRNDFTSKLRETGDADSCRSIYLEEWEFFISAITYGLYRPENV